MKISQHLKEYILADISKATQELIQMIVEDKLTQDEYMVNLRALHNIEMDLITKFSSLDYLTRSIKETESEAINCINEFKKIESSINELKGMEDVDNEG